jgi:spore maturation protein CgeB
MNVLVIGKFYVEGFALHIAETLAIMGHRVRRFEPGFRSRQSGGFRHRFNQIRGVIHAASDKLPVIRAARSRRLLEEVERGPLDAVVVCHDFLLPMEVAELKRRTGVPIAMWFPDAIVNIGAGYFMNAPYDALFFKDPFIVHRLGDSLKAPTYYLPECFNPMRHRADRSRTPDPRYRCDVCTAGNMHSWRVLVFSHLSAVDVKMWGLQAPLWMPRDLTSRQYQGRPVYNEDKAAAFLGAKIVLNTLHYGEMWGVNVRTFEAAGIGAFQLVDRRPGLSQLFEEEREIVAYDGIEDMKRKIAYWLPRDAERAEISAAAMRRAHREHTYEHRLELLLASLRGHARGFPMPDSCRA